jgi:hypothetical protein
MVGVMMVLVLVAAGTVGLAAMVGLVAVVVAVSGAHSIVAPAVTVSVGTAVHDGDGHRQAVLPRAARASSLVFCGGPRLGHLIPVLPLPFPAVIVAGAGVAGTTPCLSLDPLDNGAQWKKEEEGGGGGGGGDMHTSVHTPCMVYVHRATMPRPLKMQERVVPHRASVRGRCQCCGWWIAARTKRWGWGWGWGWGCALLPACLPPGLTCVPGVEGLAVACLVPPPSPRRAPRGAGHGCRGLPSRGHRWPRSLWVVPQRRSVQEASMLQAGQRPGIRLRPGRCPPVQCC